MRGPVVLVIVLAVVTAACSAGDDADRPVEADATTDPRAGDATATDATCDPTTEGLASVASAAGPFPWDDADAAVLDGFDTSEVLRGGPPPDGIRPIDQPCVVPIAAGDEWLGDDESVLVVEVGDEARAYPLAMMTQHEIVNDVLGGVPVAVTYCPLCNSGLAFERTVTPIGTGGPEAGVWDFGTSGRLLRSNLVMYDRQSRTLWSQFTGTALWGDPAVVGTELNRLPTQLLAWSTFTAAHPDGTVLGRDSEPSRTYGRNPYPGYEDAPSRFLFRGEFDQRLDPDERVVGLGEGPDAVAVPLTVLRELAVVTVDVGGEAITVVWTEGQASAVDDPRVADGRDVGQTGAFRVGGLEPLDDGRFRDPTTGAVHDVTGRTVEGDAPALEPVVLDDTFWFVWFAFQPDTRVAA